MRPNIWQRRILLLLLPPPSLLRIRAKFSFHLFLINARVSINFINRT